MPIVSTDIQYRLTGGASNADPNASLGGAMSSQAMPANLFDSVSSGEATAGDTEYRCVTVRNNHPTLTLQAPVLFLPTNTTGNRISVGWGTAAIDANEQTVADENTAPVGVTFTQAANKAGGLPLGVNLAPGQGKKIWVRRAVAAATAGASDSYAFRVEGDTAQ